MRAYPENGEMTTPSRKQRERLVGMLRGKTAIAGIDLLAVRNAITRAVRTRRGTDGRKLQIGANVAEVVTRLIALEGSGEANDGAVHKTNRSWRDQDGTLTEKKLRTAKRVGVEEGLMEVWEATRPGDGLLTTWYRLDMWRVAQVVVASELMNTERLREREGRKRERDRLNKKLRALKIAEKDLNLLGEWSSGNPEPAVDPLPKSPVLPAKKVALQEETQEETQEVTSVDHRSTPVGDDAEAGQIMQNIYEHMKEAGYSLDNNEYGFNLARVQGVLDNDNPSTDELSSLPVACKEYFTVYSYLDVMKALRRSRQQAARSEIMDQKPRARWGSRSSFTQHDQPEDDWE